MPASRPSYAEEYREPAGHALVVLCGALMLCWMAVFNGFPLFFPDSIVYLEGARSVAGNLFLHTPVFGEPRAEFYCLALFFLCHGAVPWAMVFVQSLAVACVVWLLVRWVVPRGPVVPYLVIVAVLSAASGLSWAVCWILTDVLGGPACLSVALLALAWQQLGRWERVAAIAIGWWSIVAHPTHVLLSAFVLALAGVLLLLPWGPRRGRWRGLGVAAALLLFSAGSLEGIHALLYGQASLTGKHPPYLMARVIADGPGRLYLRTHCPAAGWLLCGRIDTLPYETQEILWGPNGVWFFATPQDKLQVRQQEMPFVLGAVRAYPAWELRRALRNGWLQLLTCDFENFVDNAPIRAGIRAELPAGYDEYLRSRQGRDALPIRAAKRVQETLLGASGVVLLVCVPIARRRGAIRSLVLGALLLTVVGFNALICGALSQANARLQLRIVWFVPLAAMLVVAEMLALRRVASTTSVH